MENETANKALDVIVAITDERDSWQARCIAAEVALEKLRKTLDEESGKKTWAARLDSGDAIVDDFAGGNVDDAYSGGVRSGRQELAEELFHSIKALLLAGGA